MSAHKDREEKIISTFCNSHCGGTCVLRAHVRDDKIVRLETDDGEEPQLRACARGRGYRQRVYAPDRLLHPLKRTGVRGAGQFTAISWDEALDTIASQMKQTRDVYGNASILFFCSQADMNTIHHEGIINKLLCQFGGYTAPWGSISAEGSLFASGITYGTGWGKSSTQDNYLHSKLIIMWGWNPVTTIQYTNTSWYLARAREGGTRIISVDPRYTDSAAVLADQWVPIRPGTDTAVMIAMANVIIKEKLQDQNFINKYTVGFEKFRDYVMGTEDGVEKTPQWASTISGIPAETIVTLAREYATTKPAALVPGVAAGRSAYGEQYHRAAITLSAITGNIGILGGSTTVSSSGIGGTWAEKDVIKAARRATRIPAPPNPVEIDSQPRWNALPSRTATVNSAARVNVNLFADAILKGKTGGYPADFRFLWLSCTNYLNQLGDVNKAAEAFQKLDFLLVTEQFMTATARFADIVLPITTYMERNDFFTSLNSEIYALQNKVIEPIGESKSLLEICTALAARLGIKDFNDKSDEEWVESIVTQLSKNPGFPNYETFKKEGVFKITSEKPIVAFQKQIEDPEHNPFPTPSGKIEIYSETMAKMNHPELPPIPKYIESWECLNTPLAKKYPLQLVTTHSKRRAHSQFDNLPWLRERQPQAITLNRTDAELRGIKHNDLVRVFNDRGEIVIPAHVTERIMPGVIDIPQGAWFAPDDKGVDRGGCANVLTKNVISPGGAFTASTALVQVEKVRA